MRHKQAQCTAVSVLFFLFLGGGGLSEIVSAAIQKNPSVRIVMTAVTLETLRDSECLGEREIVQISAARTVTAGNYHMLRGENPVFVIRRAIN